ncbi:hypothetical protein AB0G05_23955 [Nonomuraea wenchangensis]
MDAAAATPYDELRRAHVADHRGLFDRVALDLGGVAYTISSSSRNAPTISL